MDGFATILLLLINSKCWKVMTPKLSMNTGTAFPFKVAVRLDTDKPKRGCLPPTRALAWKAGVAATGVPAESGLMMGSGVSMTVSLGGSEMPGGFVEAA